VGGTVVMTEYSTKELSKTKINILVTLDENYIPYLNVMLTSLTNSNRNCFFDVYLLHNSIRESDTISTVNILGNSGRLILIKAKNIGLDNAPVTNRYPQEIYYRIFAAHYLPTDVDKVLYLDPDIIVNGSVKELYNLPMEDYYFAAASHTGAFLTTINHIRLDTEENSPYINSGVMLMNLELLRKEQNLDEVFRFIEKRKNFMILPDQDIISSLYGSRIYGLDTFRYNMTEILYKKHSRFEKTLTLDWIRKHSVIIHYCGRNKPWKENYIGVLNVFYNETVLQMNQT
jgi:lipopolysaccharide biosynthesis glycosyltransferase